MSENHTNRIKVAPTGGGAPGRPGDAPTDRIAEGGVSEGKTVRIAPGGRPASEETRDDKLFDQYTVYSRIGTGGMGVVYLARDRRLGRFVAIKRLNRQAQSNPSLRKRFLQEAHAVAALSHAHIVHIYALGEDEDGPFIVMEYVAGPDAPPAREGPDAGGLTRPNPPLTLDRMVAKHGPLKTDEAAGLILKVGKAVAYAHSSGVIHRDLKPSNILLDKSGEPKIVDFGLARLMHRDVSKLTVPGEKLLSLGYGAPEQESDASLSDRRADVYGLGALLYFTLTGQNPRYFREQDLPPSVKDVVIKALETDRERRWPTADAFNEALNEILTRTKIEMPTVKTTWRCKWCDAVNPLSTKYCAECGWDGSEPCPECGAETFVGIQYCGACGADARAYETTARLIKKMRDAFGRKRFEYVVSSSGRVHGFEPAGPAGRRLLAEIAKLRTDAETAVRKREQLREQIPIEMRAENFERAAAFIKQFRELSGDGRAFEAEERAVPGQTLKRNLARAKRAVQNREWRLAARLCEELSLTAEPDDPDLLFIRGRLRRRAALRNGLTACAVFLGISLAYLAAVPLLARLDAPPYSAALRRFCAPGYLFYRLPGIRIVSEKYARAVLPETRTLEGWYARQDGAPPPAGPRAGEVRPPDSMKRLREEYGKKLDEIRKAKAAFTRAWPLDYLHEMEQLMEQCRTTGDFNAWKAVNAEYVRFRESRLLADEPADPAVSPELAALQNKCRQTLSEQKLAESRKLVTLCKKYVNDLSDLQKRFMQEDKMDAASAVNAEIRRVQTASEQIEAEAVVAKTEAAAGESGPSPPVLLPSSAAGRVEELETLRTAYDKVMSDIEKGIARKNAAWPDQYISKLADLMDAFQRAGDYTGWESVNDESVRFDVDRSLTPKNLSQNTKKLAAVQQEFLQIRDAIRKERDGKTAAGTEAYLKELQTLQKKLTVEGRMEAAAAVNAEIKRVKSRSG